MITDDLSILVSECVRNPENLELRLMVADAFRDRGDDFRADQITECVRIDRLLREPITSDRLYFAQGGLLSDLCTYGLIPRFLILTHRSKLGTIDENAINLGEGFFAGVYRSFLGKWEVFRTWIYFGHPATSLLSSMLGSPILPTVWADLGEDNAFAIRFPVMQQDKRLLLIRWLDTINERVKHGIPNT